MDEHITTHGHYDFIRHQPPAPAPSASAPAVTLDTVASTKRGATFRAAPRSSLRSALEGWEAIHLGLIRKWKSSIFLHERLLPRQKCVVDLDGTSSDHDRALYSSRRRSDVRVAELR
jgi:hypothetical protein